MSPSPPHGSRLADRPWPLPHLDLWSPGRADPGTAGKSEKEVLSGLFGTEAHLEDRQKHAGQRRTRGPLQDSIRAGDAAAVQLLLAQTYRFGITERDIKYSIVVAILTGNMAMLGILMAYFQKFGEPDEFKEAIAEILKEPSKRHQLHLADYLLGIAESYHDEEEMSNLILAKRRRLGRYNDGRIVSSRQLMGDLRHACWKGNTHSIAIILESDQSHLLEAADLERGLSEASEHDHEDIVLTFLDALYQPDGSPMPNTGLSAEDRLRHAIKKVASGMGIRKPSSVVLTHLMRNGCLLGHAGVVRLLLERWDVSPNHPLPGPLSMQSSSYTSSTQASWPSYSSGNSSSLAWSVSEDLRLRNEDTSKAPAEAPATDDDDVQSECISPLQVVLSSFRNLSPRWMSFSPPKGCGNGAVTRVAKLDDVAEILLSAGADPNALGGLTTYPIQMACMFASVKVIRLLIDNGADVNVRGRGWSTWLAAAGRVWDSATILATLIQAGAQLSITRGNIEMLFRRALAFFQTRKDDECRDRVREILQLPLADTIFTTGPGALLYDLLHRHYKRLLAKADPYPTVLQLAAYFNVRPMVELLLFRKVNVDAQGQYYGTALQAAARRGHADIVATLLRAGADVDAIQGKWETAIRAALAGGHDVTVRVLLEHGANPSLRAGLPEKGSESTLRLAAMGGNIPAVLAILRTQVGNLETSRSSPSPLTIACRNGHAQVAKLLLTKGSGDIRETWVDGSGRASACLTPLHAAAANGCLDTVQVLLDHGADVTRESGGSGPALLEAVRAGHIEVCKRLLAAGATIFDTIPRTWNALSTACEVGALPIVELFLSYCDHFTRNEWMAVADTLVGVVQRQDAKVFGFFLDRVPASEELLVQAAAVGSLSAVRRLLDHGIAVDAEDEQTGIRAIDAAAWFSHIDVVRILADRGAEVHEKHIRTGGLLCATLSGCIFPKFQMFRTLQARTLVSYFPEFLIPEKPRWPKWWPRPCSLERHYGEIYRSPALDPVQMWKCDEVVSFLVEKGLNVEHLGTLGSPLQLASFMGSQASVALLLGKQASVNAKGGVFGTALHAAVFGGHIPVIALLLQHGADINAKWPEVGSPLHLASSLNFGDVVRVLLEHGADPKAVDCSGDTAVTIIFRSEAMRRSALGDIVFSARSSLLQFSGRVAIKDEDIIWAARGSTPFADLLEVVLAIDLTFKVSEDLMVHLLTQQRIARRRFIYQLLDRCSDSTVTKRMLCAPVKPRHLEALLKYPRRCKITPEILQAQPTEQAIELILNDDGNNSIEITEAVVIHALEIAAPYRPMDPRCAVAQKLWWRNPRLGVTTAMLKAAHHPGDLKFLLRRGKVLRRGRLSDIPASVIDAISRRATPISLILKQVLRRYGPQVERVLALEEDDSLRISSDDDDSEEEDANRPESRAGSNKPPLSIDSFSTWLSYETSSEGCDSPGSGSEDDGSRSRAMTLALRRSPSPHPKKY